MSKKAALLTICTLAVVAVIGAAFVKARTTNKDVTCRDCNVLIVGYDTVGAKHVSSLGYDRQTTPQFDALAKEGTLFSDAYSTAPWTVPSFVSTFTSLYPSQHKVVNKYTTFNAQQQVITKLDNVAPGTQTLAQQFKNQGYVTGAFTGDSGAGSQFGNGKGFDVYYEPTPFGSIGDSATQAEQWLKQNPNKKFFMFLHGYDAHGQTKVPADYPKQGKFVPKDYTGSLTGSAKEEAELREKQLTQNLPLNEQDFAFLNGIYDSKIADGDNRFGKFWEAFRSMGLDRNTVVVVLSDHGEEWGEHGGVDHGHALYNELVHVPLAIRVPGASPKAKVSQRVSLLDVAPTILDITQVQADAAYRSQLQGKSLVPLMKGQGEKAQDIYVETDYLDFTHKRGVITPEGWKYIITMESGKEELYYLKKDPDEKDNKASSGNNRAVLEELRAKVRKHISDMGDNPDKQWTTGCLPVYPTECQPVKQ